MNPHEPIFVAPPITEIPDYVWSPRYDRPSWIPGRPVKKPKDTSRRIPHPDAESALKAAKKACREKVGRWCGRTSSQADGPDKSKRWALEEYDALPRVPHKKVTEFQHYFVYLRVFLDK